MLRLILGRAGTGKTALLFSEIAARCARRQSAAFSSYPSSTAMRPSCELAQRAAIRRASMPRCFRSRALPTASPSAAAAARAFTSISPGGFCSSRSRSSRWAARSAYTAGSARSPERMVQLLSALDELRFGCAAPDALRKASESATTSARGQAARSRAFAEALDALSAQSGADPARAARRAGRAASRLRMAPQRKVLYRRLHRLHRAGAPRHPRAAARSRT